MVGKRFATFAVFASLPTAIAQSPPLVEPRPITQPAEPRPLPPTVTARPPAVTLPRDEGLIAVDPKTITVKRLAGAWQLWANDQPARSFGDNADDANDVARTLRTLYPQRWGRIGTDRPVVEYGLTTDNDQQLVAPRVAGFARTLTPMDLKALRVEQIRGVWCLRDDASLLLNFGRHRADAEQALAVARKYGFNRIGTVGRHAPAMTFFTSDPDGLVGPARLPPSILFQAQVDAMTRTGLALPKPSGFGGPKPIDPRTVEYVGETVRIDPRKAELRADGGEFVLACGQEVLAKFGNDEYAARDATRVLRDARLTEFCTFGTAGVTFFLSNGQAPRNLPLHTQGPRFDPTAVKPLMVGGRWCVADADNRALLPAGSREEAETLIRVLQAFGFDQICTLNQGGKAVLTIPAKSR